MKKQLFIVCTLISFATFTTAQVTILSDRLGINIDDPQSALDVSGDIRINANKLYFRSGTDENHGLGWFNNYDNVTVDGPVLFGYTGGGLGVSRFGNDHLILKWSENGNVSIQDGTAQNRFQVGEGLSKLSIGNATGQDLNFGTSYVGFNAARTNSGWVFDNDGANNGGAIIYGSVGGDIYFSTEPSTAGASKTKTDNEIFNQIRMRISHDGKVTIGTRATPTSLDGINLNNYKLYVNGGILANEWLVPSVTNWGDYVFEENYKLLSLPEVSQYIKENGHLHNTPSAAEIEDEGLKVAEMTINQQVKIEELFLHLIAMDKRLEALEEKSAKLEQENKQLKALLNK